MRLTACCLWNHYVVPQFYVDETRTARWNRFSHPEDMPEYSTGFPDHLVV
jgi:microcin C transport system substrate-binding protein